MIAVSEKYALEIGSPTPITSERQHEEYLSVLDRLASKDNPTNWSTQRFVRRAGNCHFPMDSLEVAAHSSRSILID